MSKTDRLLLIQTKYYKMTLLYKVCNWTILAFAILHSIYPYFESFDFNEQLMWYHSGGLSMLLLFSINYLNSNSSQKLIERFTNVCNVATLIFMIFLCIAVAEIQVYIISLIIVTVTLVSFLKSSKVYSSNH